MIHSLGIFPESGLHWSVFSSLRPEHTLLTSSCCSSDAVSIQRCCIPPTSPIQISIRGQYVTFISPYPCCSQRKCLMSSKHSINSKRGGGVGETPSRQMAIDTGPEANPYAHTTDAISALLMRHPRKRVWRLSVFNTNSVWLWMYLKEYKLYVDKLNWFSDFKMAIQVVEQQVACSDGAKLC